ncbi:hypothetical protein DFJ58DRAFT_837778 [Suillus subalutaceus]|uniref:uncharacterized protein n=1 Tax=Suillus subalutaceus TaxID=48586 RepID=UPI001B85F89E|nr:uncharacterized protein DFJ58DRAFT_837778 [Suillus subalutaceus]KAG1868941.1 hypothetical protein DFJ58DRAFT_837778 [Suillus subalutaceus]
MCSELSEAQLEHLHEHLDILFSNLQCLPDTNKPTAKSPGSTWTLASGQDSIKIVTNPCFYQIQKIGGRKRTVKRPAVIRRPQDFHITIMNMQGWDSKRKKPEQRKPQKTTNQADQGPVTSASNRTNKKHSADLEYNTNSNSNTHDGSASETNSLFDQKDDSTAESEMDSLFDYDGSGEEADEEGNDSDVSIMYDLGDEVEYRILSLPFKKDAASDGRSSAKMVILVESWASSMDWSNLWLKDLIKH